MMSIKRKRVTLHPLNKDGTLDMITNLYPKCFVDGIVDREGNPIVLPQNAELDLNNIMYDWARSDLGALLYGNFNNPIKSKKNGKDRSMNNWYFDFKERLDLKQYADVSAIVCHFTSPNYSVPDLYIDDHDWSHEEWHDRAGEVAEYKKEICKEDNIVRYTFYPDPDEDIWVGKNKSGTPDGYIKLNDDGDYLVVTIELDKPIRGRVYLNAIMDGWSSEDNLYATYYRSSDQTQRMNVECRPYNGGWNTVYIEAENANVPYVNWLGPDYWTEHNVKYSNEGYCPWGLIELDAGLNQIKFQRLQTRSLLIAGITIVAQELSEEEVPNEVVFYKTSSKNEEPTFSCVDINEDYEVKLTLQPWGIIGAAQTIEEYEPRITLWYGGKNAWSAEFEPWPGSFEWDEFKKILMAYNAYEENPKFYKIRLIDGYDNYFADYTDCGFWMTCDDQVWEGHQYEYLHIVTQEKVGEDYFNEVTIVYDRVTGEYYVDFTYWFGLYNRRNLVIFDNQLTEDNVLFPIWLTYNDRFDTDEEYENWLENIETERIYEFPIDLPVRLCVFDSSTEEARYYPAVARAGWDDNSNPILWVITSVGTFEFNFEWENIDEEVYY